MLGGVLARAPAHLQPAIRRLIALPLVSKDELVDALNEYALKVDQAATKRGDLDVNLAECISRSCRTLLRDCWSTMDDQQRQLIQMACYYYIEEEDEESDLKSVFGFDDDAELLNVVLNCLERPDLIVQI